MIRDRLSDKFRYPDGGKTRTFPAGRQLQSTFTLFFALAAAAAAEAVSSLLPAAAAEPTSVAAPVDGLLLPGKRSRIDVAAVVQLCSRS